MIFFFCRYFQHDFQNILSRTPSELVSNSLGPDQAQHSVGPDLGPNCLQRSSGDDKNAASRYRVSFHSQLGLSVLVFFKSVDLEQSGLDPSVCMQVKINQLLNGKTAAYNIFSSVWSGLRTFHFKWLETSYSN